MIWWPAPAKLNLMLRILGRQDDGYHRLQTVFQFLSLADQLAFDVTSNSIERHHDIVNVPENMDLTLRAAHLLKQASGVKRGVTIYLNKKLPVGGGLGGGSSDAATTLVILNELWRADFSQPALESLGLQLGADVPIFIRGHACWAEGVGQTLRTIDLVEPWYLVIQPQIHVSTAQVFRDPALIRNSQPIREDEFFAGNAQNDCLAAVRRLFPEVQQAIDWLSNYGNAKLTGTGACIFAQFPNYEAACAVKDKVPRVWDSFVSQGKNMSPLLEKISENTHNPSVL